MTTVAETLAAAVRAHQAGNLRQAEQFYRDILQAEPQHVDARRHDGVFKFVGRGRGVTGPHRVAVEVDPDAARPPRLGEMGVPADGGGVRWHDDARY